MIMGSRGCLRVFQSFKGALKRKSLRNSKTREAVGLWAISVSFHLDAGLVIDRSLVVRHTPQSAREYRLVTRKITSDDVELTNQVWALKTGSGIQKSRRAVRLPFQSTFNLTLVQITELYWDELIELSGKIWQGIELEVWHCNFYLLLKFLMNKINV